MVPHERTPFSLSLLSPSLDPSLSFTLSFPSLPLSLFPILSPSLFLTPKKLKKAKRVRSIRFVRSCIPLRLLAHKTPKPNPNPTQNQNERRVSERVERAGFRRGKGDPTNRRIKFKLLIPFPVEQRKFSFVFCTPNPFNKKKDQLDVDEPPRRGKAKERGRKRERRGVGCSPIP